MVRTAATTFRASGGKSSKASKSSTTAINVYKSSTGDTHTGGGNPIHPRETPSWQKPITKFFTKPVEGAINEDDIKIKQVEDNEEEKEEFSGEGTSTMSNVDETKIEEGETSKKDSNKENAVRNGNENKNDEMGIKKRSLETDEDIDTRPKKKPKADFYRYLEEIENNSG